MADSTSVVPARVMRGGAAAFLFCGAVAAGSALFSATEACSARAVPIVPMQADCAGQEAPYELAVLEDYDSAMTFGWYNYGDSTPGAIQSGQDGGATLMATIPNGGRCADPTQTDTTALFFYARGFQDYGCGWGSYDIGAQYSALQGKQSTQPDGAPCELPPDGDAGAEAGICPVLVQADGGALLDGSSYEGIAFWARSYSYDPIGAPTSKSFTITINDKESFAGVDSTCVNYDASFLSNGSAVYSTAPNTSGGPSGGSVTSALPPPNACGNGFAYVLTTTDQWQLYTLPWSDFNELARPNRQPTRFDPSSFYQITIAAPKEAHVALWWDKFSFYRRK